MSTLLDDILLEDKYFRAEAFSVTFKYFCYFQMGFVTFILGLSLSVTFILGFSIFCYFHFGTFVFCYFQMGFVTFIFFFTFIFLKTTSREHRVSKPQSSRLSNILVHGAFLSYGGTDVAVWPQVCQVQESFVSERHCTSRAWR